MIVFLKKIRSKTVFSKFEPVKVEPFELEYLKSVLDSIEVKNYIIDDLFSLRAPKDALPGVIVLTGYNVSEREIVEEAKKYKQEFPKVKVIVGGVHIQRNNREFHKPYIDYVCHSQSLEMFKKLIEGIKEGRENIVSSGLDSYIYNKDLNKKEWRTGDRGSILEQEKFLADRTILNKTMHNTRYLEKRRVALIKGSIGCNYNCSYCYCKEINEGHFIAPDYQKMAWEIGNINADYFWIVDDVIFSNRRQALEFIEVFKAINTNTTNNKVNINTIQTKKLIIYLRADFILKNSDLLKSLKEIGVVEVIVGFESISNEELKDYEKTTNALDYPLVISLLKENKIDLTALFMVNPNYKLSDFRRLNLFIKKNKIEVFTISILTPIRGTKTYQELEKDLTTTDPKRFDFLHLVLPSTLPKPMFYIMFYGLQLRLLLSKRIWKYILRK